MALIPRSRKAIGRALTAILVVVVVASVALGVAYEGVVSNTGAAATSSQIATSTSYISQTYSNGTYTYSSTQKSACAPTTSTNTQYNSTMTFCYVSFSESYTAPTLSITISNNSTISYEEYTTCQPITTSRIETSTYNSTLTINGSTKTITRIFGNASTSTTTIECNAQGPLRITAIQVSQINCTAFNFTAFVSGGNPPYRYAWDFGDGPETRANDSSAVHDYAASGKYVVSIEADDTQGTPDGSSAVVYKQLVILVPPSGCNAST
ncbi:MAG: PKD domain-containing protein [Nitrososphaerales archaeon]